MMVERGGAEVQQAFNNCRDQVQARMEERKSAEASQNIGQGAGKRRKLGDDTLGVLLNSP